MTFNQRRRPYACPNEFRLSATLDESLLAALGATADMPRGCIIDLIKEYLVRRGKRCALCGKTYNRRELNIDRRRPASKEGGDNIENLQLLCRGCVVLKGTGSMLDVRKRMRLNKKGKR